MGEAGAGADGQEDSGQEGNEDEGGDDQDEDKRQLEQQPAAAKVADQEEAYDQEKQE